MVQPLIHGFTATTVWKAFALNALASSFIVLIAISVKDQLDHLMYILQKKTSKKPEKVPPFNGNRNSIPSLVGTFIVTFFAAFLAYTLLHLAFGFGKGMLAVSN